MEVTNVERLDKERLNDLAKKIGSEGVELDRFVRSDGNGMVVGKFYEWNNDEYFIFIKNGEVRSLRKLGVV